MTDHAIKINRALSVAQIGRCDGSARAMLDYLPDSALAALPSAALAETLDALWHACQDAKAIATREAVAAGALWDERSQRLRAIAA